MHIALFIVQCLVSEMDLDIVLCFSGKFGDTSSDVIGFELPITAVVSLLFLCFHFGGGIFSSKRSVVKILRRERERS